MWNFYAWRDRYLRKVSIPASLEYSLSMIFGLGSGLYMESEYSNILLGAIVAVVGSWVGIVIAKALHKYVFH